MTDKEIIIDGVDVSECEYILADKFCAYDIWKAIECSKFHNCIYKQLKRLEFENKLLKADYEASEQENTRLIEDNGKLFDKAMETRKENVALQDTLFTYRQTLQEIKEIAELSYQMKLEDKDCIICDDYLGQILQKISEVNE